MVLKMQYCSGCRLELDRWLASILKLTCFETYLFHRCQFLDFYYECIYLGWFLPTCLRKRDMSHVTVCFVRDSRSLEEILTARNLRRGRISSPDLRYIKITSIDYQCKKITHKQSLYRRFPVEEKFYFEKDCVILRTELRETIPKRLNYN